MKKIFYSFVGLTLLLNTSLSAWWDAGHMAVAQIAYEELQPEVTEKADAYIAAVSHSFPNYSNFIMASLWADDIVHDGIDSFREWHGSARPYDPQNILTPEQHLKILASFEGHDIVWAIGECVNTLQDPEATDWAKGFMLRMLIHIAADIHQPCHCTSYYSSEFPEGDRAGTRFKIKHDKYKSLHHLFDGAFGLCDRQPERPMNEGDKLYQNDLVAYLRKNYPRTALQLLNENNVDQWRQESYEIGVNFAYPNISSFGSPSEKFMAEGKVVCGRRLALAGYRLADLLNRVLSDQNNCPN